MKLRSKHCKPCEEGTPPLSADESQDFIKNIDNWLIEGDKNLEKILKFDDFREALNFVNKVGEIAEIEGHHPDIGIFGYNKVKVRLYTHAIGGLSENDFILAAKIDELNRQR